MKITNIIIALLMVLAMPVAASAFEITAPQGTYNTTMVPVQVSHNATLDYINYSVDNGSTQQGCSNCSQYNATLNMSEGNHSITANAAIGNQTFSSQANFTVILPAAIVPVVAKDFTISIVRPIHKTYYDAVQVNITANRTLDSISYKLSGNYTLGCENCSAYSAMLNIQNGSYTLYAKGVLGNVSKEVSVSFTVEPKPVPCTNCTKPKYNYTHNYSGPRFGLGFEKLPKQVESGNITDDELAEIIRTNKFNPGIINRLIKTGKLGNESLTAILETQFNPMGIFGKMFSWMGFKHNTYASAIYETYNLTPQLEVKLVARDDLPKKYAEKMQQRIREHQDESQEDNDGNEAEQERERNQAQLNKSEQPKPGKSLEIGKQNGMGKGNDDSFVPPGQAKKMGGNSNKNAHKETGNSGNGKGKKD
jgi:hypothetical protein